MKAFGRCALLAATLAALTGCEFAGSAQDQILKLQGDLENYVNSNINHRVVIREQNWMSIQQEAQKLDADGKHDEARAFRCKYYPPLLALGTARRAGELEESQALRDIDKRIAGCLESEVDMGAPVASTLE